MNSLINPIRNQIQLVVAPYAGREMMLTLASRLSPGNVVRVLDGGNQFNAYTVSREIRRHTAELNHALSNIRLARGFTCYQMVMLLADTPTIPERPVLVLDLLATFYDESVPLAESRRLLENTIIHLRRLCRTAPVMVSARPPSTRYPERLMLLDLLRSASSQITPAEVPAFTPYPASFKPGFLQKTPTTG
jgi:hypothetical protein